MSNIAYENQKVSKQPWYIWLLQKTLVEYTEKYNLHTNTIYLFFILQVFARIFLSKI